MAWLCPSCGSLATLAVCDRCGKDPSAPAGTGKTRPTARTPAQPVRAVPSGSPDRSRTPALPVRPAPPAATERSRTPVQPAPTVPPRAAPTPTRSYPPPVEPVFLHQTMLNVAEGSTLHDYRKGHGIRTVWRTLGSLIALGVLGVVGYVVVVRLGDVHVRARWDDDPSIAAEIGLAAQTEAGEEESVKLVCNALADLSTTLHNQLTRATVAARPELAKKALWKWECLEDARDTIERKPMPAKAAEEMAACGTVSQRMGNYLRAVGGEHPDPAILPDGAKLANIARDMRTALAHSHGGK